MGIKFDRKDFDIHIGGLQKELSNIEKKKIKVGIFGDKQGGKGKNRVINYAAAHEYGAKIQVSPKMRGFLAIKKNIFLKKTTKYINIPQRSFLHKPFHSKEFETYILKHIETNLLKVIQSKQTIKQLLNRIGLKASFFAKLNIINHKITPKTQGSGKTTLVQDGRLVGSIQHKVEE